MTIHPERRDRYLCRGGVSSRVKTRGENRSVGTGSWLCDMEARVTNGAPAACCRYLSGLQLSAGSECVCQGLCLYRSSQALLSPSLSLSLVVFLTFVALISGAEGAGMRGMQALGLPVYSEGFLQCRPPQPPPRLLPFKDFSHFCPGCCFGNRSRARHTGASHSIPGFFPTARIISSVLTCRHFGCGGPEINRMTSFH